MIFYLIYPFSFVISRLPRKVQYWLSDFIGWFLYKVMGYRVNVVKENLRNSFPSYRSEELLEIEKRFYSHLGDIFTEILTLPAVSMKRLRKRMVYLNVDELEIPTQGRSIVVMMAHFGSWEYGSSYAMYTRHEALYGVYRPLQNKKFDKFFLRCRSRFGLIPVPMSEIAKVMFQKRHSERGVIAALIADQAPPRYGDVPWIDFLNQPTQFFTGGERLSQKMKMPVYITYVDKVDRGRYTTKFELIYDGTEDVTDFEITRRYAVKLEEMIRRRPELWMWSHRRWKRKPLDDE